VSVSDRRDDITEALQRFQAGEKGALDRLVERIYPELHRLAHRQLAGRKADTLDTTGLVNEVYLKLAARPGAPFEDRAHFFAVAARAMRHIVIDYARERGSQKRGGGQPHIPLDEGRIAVEQEADRLLALDALLQRLAGVEERLARIVECLFFAGLTEEETAAALGVSERTVQREWARAKAWLKDAMAR
jgi:RNA polymerase sigma factor (TIGR02999 family)